MMQSIEHAAGSIKRVVAFRLKPGMDVLKGIEEICKAENIHPDYTIHAFDEILAIIQTLNTIPS